MGTPTRLFNRDFLLLSQGQFISQIGNNLYGIAMMFWIKHATGSASLMGLVMTLTALPGVLLGPLAGTFADRYSRRSIIILSDLFNGVAVLILAGLLFMAPSQNGIVIPWLMATSVLIAVVGAFFRPAISASIPDLVPADRVATANSLSQSSAQAASFIGQGVGGTLFRVLGAAALFLLDGLSYLYCAFCELFMRIPQKIPPKALGARAVLRQFKSDTSEGFHYVWQRRGMRNLFLAAAVLNFLTSPFAVLLPFFIEDHLHVTTDWFGFIVASIGVGALLGYGLAGLLKLSGRARSMAVIASLLLAGAALAALGMSRTPVCALAVAGAVGLLTGLININIATILQTTTPSEIRGRVFGLLGTLALGLAPIGMGLAGPVADLTGRRIPLIFVACGVLMVAFTLAVATDRDFRAYLASGPADGGTGGGS